MVTGESSYDKVVLAAECSPDDYLLKPFTAEELNIRLESLLERRDAFTPVDLAYDRKDWARTLEECDRIIAEKNKYFLYACKIRGAMLLKLNRAQDAAAHYREMLAIKPLPWARLGLAKACNLLGDNQQAEALVREVLQDTPQFTVAYDFLGDMLTQKGAKEDALQVLQKARAISPGTMSRIRHIGTLAVQTGRYDVAEQIMQEALQQHKYSPVREAGDFVLLSRALTNQGKTDQALKALSEAKGSFRDSGSQTTLAANQSMVYHQLGDHGHAEAALAEAMAAGGQMSVQVAASVAEACFALGQEDKANDLLKHLIQNHPDDDRVRGQVHAVLSSAGKDAAEADAIIEASVKEVIHINNEGVRKAEAGELEEAIALLSDAAKRLPDNLQIVSNAALVMALDLSRNSYNPDRLKECLHYRSMVMEKFPAYPKLVQIDALLKQVRKT
jgi:tetratricopeptide (TPR) repeat protein